MHRDDQDQMITAEDGVIVPAPTDTMLNMGEGYVIKDATDGHVLAAHTDGEERTAAGGPAH